MAARLVINAVLTPELHAELMLYDEDFPIVPLVLIAEEENTASMPFVESKKFDNNPISTVSITKKADNLINPIAMTIQSVKSAEPQHQTTVILKSIATTTLPIGQTSTTTLPQQITAAFPEDKIVIPTLPESNSKRIRFSVIQKKAKKLLTK